MKGWQHQAACKGRPELFLLVDRESGFGRDIEDSRARDLAIKSHNLSNIKKALEICDRCPVADLCDEDADSDDRMWTVRGGRPPTSLRLRVAGRPKLEGLDDRACRNGHIGHYKRRADGSAFCTECKRERDRAAYSPAPRKEPDYLPGTCIHGHVDMLGKDSRGHRKCYMCDRIRIAKRKAARMSS